MRSGGGSYRRSGRWRGRLDTATQETREASREVGRAAEAGDKRKTGTREETHAWTWTRRVFYNYFLFYLLI
jgi:hypothetical protein